MPSSLYQQYQPGGSLMDQYQQFKMNPMGALSQRFNTPQNISNPSGGSLIDRYQQFMKNPMGALLEKYNIPKNISNPDDILQYLLNTRQISQQQVNSAMQMRSMFN